MAQNSKQMRERLAEIDAWLASGAKSITLDGMTVSIDPAQLRAERTRIEAQLPEFTKRRKGPYGVTGLGG